jgi:glyoxylase-like metal-dependent hydrolase (beta-lactamase superfamily II)
MRIHQMAVGPFEMNCYIVAEDTTPQCLLIDPGDEPDVLIEFIENQHLQPVRIINTHNHIDHARRVCEIQKHFNIPYYIHEDDLPLLESLKNQALLFGLDISGYPDVTGFLKDNDTFDLVRTNFQVLHTPGHSPGSICLSTPGHVFVGDVLFKDSIGRTDLYGGNFKALLKSIMDKLLVLPDETIVYCGHGPTTTIGREKKHNPFLNPSAISFS